MFSSDFYRNFFMMLYVIFVPLEAWASAEKLLTKAIEIRLESEIQVAGDKIILGDVATIYAKSIHDFQALSSLVIGQIPQDSKQLKLPITYLRARVKEILPEGSEISIKAPLEISFHQEKFGVSSEEIAQQILRDGVIRGKIPNTVEVIAEPISGFDKLDIFKLSNLKIEPAGETPYWKGEMNFKVSSKDSQNTTHIWLKAKLRWFTDAWVAKTEIRPYQNLAANQFKKVRTEITNNREDLIAASDEAALALLLKSGRSKRVIRAESPITTAMLDRKPDMNPGQKLRVVFISENGLQVSAEGAIMGAGTVGDDVKARLRSSKKIVTGKLVSEGLMEVSL